MSDWNCEENRKIKVRRVLKNRGFLDLLLKYRAEGYGLEFDENGFTPVAKLANVMKRRAYFGSIMPGEEVIRDTCIMFPEDFELSADRKKIRSRYYKPNGLNKSHRRG